jgi:hypothetical protein
MVLTIRPGRATSSARGEGGSGGLGVVAVAAVVVATAATSAIGDVVFGAVASSAALVKLCEEASDRAGVVEPPAGAASDATTV